MNLVLHHVVVGLTSSVFSSDGTFGTILCLGLRELTPIMRPLVSSLDTEDQDRSKGQTLGILF